MAQEIMAAFKEVITRIQDAETTLFDGIKLVEGPTEDVLEDRDLPIIIYELLNGGDVEDAAFPRCARAKITVLFTIMCAVSKGYYNDDKDGIIDLYEKLMTVIDGYPTVDLTGATHWGPVTPQYRVGGFERDGMRYSFLVEADIQTAKYHRGALQL